MPPFRCRVLLSSALAISSSAALDAQSDLLYRVPAQRSGELFGYSLAAIGDWNSDGVSEVAVGAPMFDGMGAVYVLSGADGSILASVLGSQSGDHFGTCVEAIGDLTGDGLPEIAIGSPEHDLSMGDEGRVVLVESGTATVLRVVDGQEGDLFGTSISSARDHDGDGFRDFLVGGPGVLGTPNELGVVRLISGADGSTLHTFVASVDNNEFGRSVVEGGDTDGDGVGDILIGDPSRELVHVLDGLSLAERMRIQRTNPGFGAVVATMPDIDGDQCAEIVCLDPCGAADCRGGSLIEVFSGKNGGYIERVSGGNSWSTHLSADHDFTGDGVPELRTDGYLISGGTFQPLQSYHHWLSYLDGVGTTDSVVLEDLDGDGLQDLALGAGIQYRDAPPALYVLPGRKFFLYQNVSSRGNVTTLMGEGVPGNPALLIIEDINGVPCMCPFGGIQLLDSEGRHSRVDSATGLSGLTIGLRAYTLDSSRRLTASPRVLLVFP